MKPEEGKPKPRRYRVFLPYVVLLAGLLFTTIVSYDLLRIAEAEDRARFRNSVHEIDAAIAGRVDTYIALLRAGTGLFAASHSVERDEFKRYISRLELEKQYPGLQGIGFSLRVSSLDKEAITATMRSQGAQDFKIWPADLRSEYYPVVYLEPQSRLNETEIGYDMFSDPVLRAAMERARDTGLGVASGGVSLPPGNEHEQQLRFLIFMPVYQNDADPASEAARRAGLDGFLYSLSRLDQLLAAIPATTKYDDIQFQIYDSLEGSGSTLLHDSSQTGDPNPRTFRPRFIATTPLSVAGRTWKINFATRPKFDTTSTATYVPYVLSGGILISLLFFGITRSQTRAGAAAERAAAELSKSEVILRKTLADRERAEEALKESEERYRELVENANDIVYTLDLEGKLTSVNRAAESITGYSRDELLTKPIAEMLTPESAAVSKSMLERRQSGEERANYELDFRAKSGRILALEISSRLILKKGRLVEVQGIARDITVRRRAEEALREADQRALSEYERLLERISGLAQVLGTARDLVTIFRGLREFTLVSVPSDGIFVSLYDPLREHRTACYGWGDGYEIDVSDLPPMPVTTSGPNSRAVRTRQAVITEDYMSTQSSRAVIVGPDNGLRPKSSLVIPMVMMGNIVGTIEVQSYSPAAYKEEHVTAMQLAANLAAVAIENVRLLERESRARKSAEESNRLKDEFLATVSHELRTPLTAILGWSRMLETGSLEGATTARAIETIRRNAKFQSQIIDDILDVSRIITGNLHIDLLPIELSPVIETAINVVRPTAEAKGIKIEVELESHPALVSGDSNRLQQVFWNLLSNAIKFTPAGGRVRIATHEIKSQVEISVSDTGEGISPEFLPFAFDRFRQADSTTTRRHSGLGLGLAIARHLVEIHGGSIKGESPGQGKGSTFIVTLPLAASIAKLDKRTVKEAESLPAATAPLNGLRVLVVEDDRDTLELLSAALKQQKAEVTAVQSADEAMEAMSLSLPDVLVSDIAMPGKDGYELIRRVKVMTLNGAKSIPAVAITAYAGEEDRQKALSAGYRTCLAKPIELAELVLAVADAARSHNLPKS